MNILGSAGKSFVPIIECVALTIGYSSTAAAQTFIATIVGNNSIVSTATFDSVDAAGGNNINGASVIRVPSWIPTAEKVHRGAQYYMYFSHHGGDDIRFAWSEAVTGPWHFWNGEGGRSPDRAEGSRGGHSGTRTPGNGVFDIDLGGGTARPSDNSDVGVFNHVASPDVHVDDANQQIVLYWERVILAVMLLTALPAVVTVKTFSCIDPVVAARTSTGALKLQIN